MVMNKPLMNQYEILGFINPNEMAKIPDADAMNNPIRISFKTPNSSGKRKYSLEILFSIDRIS
jgi:hypothetical protein